MSQWAKARDANEKGVIAALKTAGWSVDKLQPVGRNNGLPDLIIGKHGHTTTAEVKRPMGPRGGKSDKRLSPEQERWHDEWKGARPLVLDSADNRVNVARAEAWLVEKLGGVHMLPCYCPRCAGLFQE